MDNANNMAMRMDVIAKMTPRVVYILCFQEFGLHVR